jgi:predicted amidohydrolase YtcJ
VAFRCEPHPRDDFCRNSSGKLADFVAVADDPHTVNQEKIKDIEIVRTVTGGSTVYEE